MSSDSEAVLERARVLLGDFERAVERLAGALGEPENEFIRDAAIQRFEFSFELAWKSIQVSARREGQECASPRMAISTAWRNEWISDEAAWLDMLEERNKTSHTYRQSMAAEVFANLPDYLPLLKGLCETLSKRLREI